jgi:hypothetical protein
VISDTSRAAQEIINEGLRRMTAAAKLEQVRAMTLAVQELALLDIRRRHPDASERELELRLASRWLGPELMRRAFGWDPDREGY